MSEPTLTFRLSSGEHALLTAAADPRGMSVAGYLLAQAKADREAQGDRERRKVRTSSRRTATRRSTRF